MVVGGVACALAGSSVLDAQALKDFPKDIPEAQAKALRDAAEAHTKAAVAREVMRTEVVLRQRAANLDAQRQQMVRALRPFLRAEYHLIRTVCTATPEQRREIARAGERALRDAAAGNPTIGLMVIGGAGPRPVDPLGMIQKGLATAVKDHLPPEQIARYQDERKRKAQAQKRLAVRMLVTELDQEMRLSDDQRVAITKSLLEHWDDSWGASLMCLTALQNLQNFFPPVADDLVVPFLSPAQKHVWQGGESKRGRVVFGVSPTGIDPGIEDEELTEAREAEDRLQANPK